MEITQEVSILWLKERRGIRCARYKLWNTSSVGGGEGKNNPAKEIEKGVNSKVGGQLGKCTVLPK